MTDKYTSLDDYIKKQLKDEEFASYYKKELLINDIAKQVVGLRSKNHYTQSELAERAGTTQPVIARLESGTDTRMPSLDLLARIADAAHSKLNLSFGSEQNARSVDSGESRA